MNVSREQAAVKAVASELAREGYLVQIEPPLEAIPFDLKGYRPDILAHRGQDHLIVEVKARGRARNLEKYKELSDIIGAQPNWRFMLSTVNPEEVGEAQPTGAVNPNISDVAGLLNKIDSLLHTDSFQFAIPYLWSAYMTGMRIYAMQHQVPVDVNSDLRVINYMYSLGEMSSEDYETSRRYLSLRNEVVHRLIPDATQTEVMALRDFVGRMLEQWQLLNRTK